MRNSVSKLVSVTATAVLGFALLTGVASPVKADSPGDKAVVTFNRPVEVPGKVLPPGSYVFKSLDNEELVQVFSADGKQLFATVSVIPEDRPANDTDNDSLIQLGRTRADAPQEVEGFFLAGRTTGFQFVYPTPRRH
jgi:hypothetical protein